MGGSKAITLPLTDETIDTLRVGDHVAFSGVIYTARDAAHKRLIAIADAGEDLPLDLRGQVILLPGDRRLLAPAA